jgi:hypothetical protein
MDRVRPIAWTRVLGIPCVLVESFRNDKAAILVPLWLTRHAAFVEAVCDAASPANPLRHSLENGGTAAERLPYSG